MLAVAASAQTPTGESSSTSNDTGGNSGAQTSGISATGSGDTSSSNPVADYFSNWFARVSKTQAEQPHWVTPLVTVTPRLEEELRYDQMWESDHDGHSLTSYGGGKGLELIPAERIELIIGVPGVGKRKIPSRPKTDGPMRVSWSNTGCFPPMNKTAIIS